LWKAALRRSSRIKSEFYGGLATVGIFIYIPYMTLERRRLRLKIGINADPTKVYDAITNPLKLSIWFCNKAEVNPKLRGAVKFSGENLVATSFPEKGISGAITALDPNRSIGFSWPIGGKESNVLFLIDDRGRSSELLVSHDKIPEKSHMMDAWISYLYNLKSYVEFQRPAYRLDYSQLDTGTVKREIFIEALPAVVFKALTDQNELRIWFGADAEIEAKEGGKYLSGWKDKKGNAQGPREIKELIENKKLAYDWIYDADKGVGDTVTWELLRIGEKTRVSLRHSGFDPARNNRDYVQGWHAFILTLKDFCENRGQLSFEVVDGDWSL